MKPIFIFSLPRSGSTLLQRILATSGQISTAAEPWILLPYIYTLKFDGVISEYCHSYAVGAIKDFYEGFPNGKQDYIDELRVFILNLYKKKSDPGSQYFLDKTPRYHLICDEIIKLFPDGKFIFLWRNPLAVVSSIIHSWCNGKWKIVYHNIDLHEGIKKLLSTFIVHKSRVHTIQYEKLIQDPSVEVRKLCDYLEIDYNDRMIDSFKNIRFAGRMGDKTGTKKYNLLSNASLDTWKNTFSNPFRRYWASRYLAWIGEDNLEIMGYDYSELKAALLNGKRFSFDYIVCDLLRALFNTLRRYISPLGVNKNKSVKHLWE